MQHNREPETGRGGYETAQRHGQVLADGPRIEAIPNDQIDAQSWDLVNTLRAAAGVICIRPVAPLLPRAVGLRVDSLKASAASASQSKSCCSA